jgi:hypothetical protein
LNLPATSIVEIKTTLAGARKEFDCELLKLTRGEVVVIYRMPGEVQLEDLLLPKDAISIGYFWEDRAYNAYHWIDEQSQTLALYFNICDSAYIESARDALCVDPAHLLLEFETRRRELLPEA